MMPAPQNEHGPGVRKHVEAANHTPHTTNTTASALRVNAYPAWLPARGAAMCTDDEGTNFYCWRLDAEFACIVSITPTLPDGCDIAGTKRGVRIDHLLDTLATLGLIDPAAADWQPIPVEIAQIWHDALMQTGHAA